MRVSKIVFSACGREDVNVRMLGTGRPFSLELTNCENVLESERLSEVQNSMHASMR